MRFFLIIFLFLSFKAESQMTVGRIIPRISTQVYALSEVMKIDATHTAAAARFYAYSMLAAYEILCQLDSSRIRFQQEFRGYPLFLMRPEQRNFNRELAVLYGILETGRLMMPSGALLEEKQRSLVEEYKKLDFPEQTISSSISIAKQISSIIVQFSRSDGYQVLRRRVSINGTEVFISMLETGRYKTRPFFLDSTTQFRPVATPQSDKTNNSAFYLLMKEVYDVSNQLTNEQKLIAEFWDHSKNLSPAGHWLHIAGITSGKANLLFEDEVLLNTVLAIALYDASMSSWEEKYRANAISPVTAINRYLDEKWKPYLPQPPFPGYSSSQSVISATSAEILSFFLGENFPFTDNTGVTAGLASRNFNSFRDAAIEASMSVLYAGSHFPDAIKSGEEQGRRIGAFIVEKMKLWKGER